MPAYHLGFEGFNFVSFFGVVFASLIATTAMLLVLDVIHLLGVTKPEPIHTIGGLLTGDTENSFWLGFFFHYLMGAVFSLGYFVLIQLLPFHTLFSVAALSSFLGMMHGLVIGFLLLISVAEHHRDRRMRATGTGVVFSYVIAHGVYGLVLGAALGQFFVRNTSSLDLIGALTSAGIIFGFNAAMLIIPAYAFWRVRLETRALQPEFPGVVPGLLDNAETLYKAGRVFPEQVRTPMGGDRDPYAKPEERGDRAA